MRSKVNPFDVLFAAALLCALFTIGFHAGKSEEQTKEYDALVFIKIEKLSLSDNGATDMKIDGKYELELISVDGNFARILLRVTETDAGYLLGGAKYVSKNQPISATGTGSYMSGRVAEIKRIS